MGILGFSGCGKSTLARCITGIEGPDHGKILYRGQDISGLHGKRRKHICKTSANRIPRCACELESSPFRIGNSARTPKVSKNRNA
ncbi:MAG: ATP-binding cassette domain-containing protein [Enterocloster clostridioformis]